MAENGPVLFIAVYTDEDVTNALAPALRQRGYIAQSAVEAGNLGMSDLAQLAYAAEQGMAILTYNVQDFVPLARDWFAAHREHAGIILSEQFAHNQLGELLRRLLRLLDTLTADEMRNRVVFLQEFKR